MCHMDTCIKWKFPHHMALMPCAPLTSCHVVATWSCYVALLLVSPDTRCLEKREILTILESHEIRLGNYISRDDSNGEVRFLILDLEKLQVFNLYYYRNYRFTIFQKNLIFLGFYILPPLKEFRPKISHQYTLNHMHMEFSFYFQFI